MKRRESFGPGDLAIQNVSTSNLISGGASADYDTLKEIEDKIKSIEENGTASINEIKIVGELDSVVDLNIAGKVTSDGGEILNDYKGNKATGQNSLATGSNNTASGNSSHAEGNSSTACGTSSHAEGTSTTAYGNQSHSEGVSTNKQSSVIEVTNTTTNDEIITSWNSKRFSFSKGVASHVEGKDCLALGDNSHAEGYSTLASGISSHSEGAAWGSRFFGGFYYSFW